MNGEWLLSDINVVLQTNARKITRKGKNKSQSFAEDKNCVM